MNRTGYINDLYARLEALQAEVDMLKRKVECPNPPLPLAPPPEAARQ